MKVSLTEEEVIEAVKDFILKKGINVQVGDDSCRFTVHTQGFFGRRTITAEVDVSKIPLSGTS